MLGTYITSLIRTLVPMIVGWALSLPFAGPILDVVHVDPDTASLYAGQLVGFVLAFVYYVVVRWLEQRWPKLGVLLGVPARPTYINPDGTITAPPAKDPALISAVVAGNLADTRELPAGFTPNDPDKPDHLAG